jgi:UDP-glucose 4-epimerase
VTYSGIRPGEKIHEILVSEEEESRTEVRGENLVILPILPELREASSPASPVPFAGEYSSASNPLSLEEVRTLLDRNKLTLRSMEDGSAVRF